MRGRMRGLRCELRRREDRLRLEGVVAGEVLRTQTLEFGTATAAPPPSTTAATDIFRCARSAGDQRGDRLIGHGPARTHVHPYPAFASSRAGPCSTVKGAPPATRSDATLSGTRTDRGYR